MANVQYYDVILKPVVTDTQKQQNLRLKKLLKRCLQELK